MRTLVFQSGSEVSTGAHASIGRAAFDARTTILESYSTTNAGRSATVTYWNDLHCRLFLPLEVRPLDRGRFAASMRFGHLGPVAFAETSSQPAIVDHTMQHVSRTHERWFSLMISLRGKIELAHYGRDVVLEEGDFVLQDSQAAARMSLPNPNQALSLRLTPETLRAYLPTPESVCGLRMSGSRGLGRTVRALVPSLWAQVEEGLPPEISGSLANGLLELIAAAYAIEHKTAVTGSTVKSVRKAQIRRLVEARLADPDLSVMAVAASLNVSPRYVHRVFAGEDESLSGYILRRRLEECAARLASPLWHGRTVTETAFSWGFCSTAHFSRSFKERFGESPTQFRRRRLARDNE